MVSYRDRVLDRIPEFDERSRSFAAVSPIDTRPLRSYTWSCDVYNDQGQEGACVGFGWTHELAARPHIIRRDAEFARGIYHRARQLDDRPGEDYEGTSVLAGAKAIQELQNSKGKKYFDEYRWAFGIQDTLRVIGYAGPVVLGVNWYDGMFDPDPRGFIVPDGELAGGHCILANGVKIVRFDKTLPATWDNIDKDASHVRLHNSWGTGYGIGGDVFITVAGLDKLLQEDGDACVPSYRHGE